MKKKLIIALGGVAVVVATIVGVLVYNSTRVTAEYASDYNRIFGEFTAESTHELIKGKKENTCYSPASLFATLTLAAECTNDKTREEILKGLNVESLDELQETYKKMFESIDVETQNTKILLANSLWIDDKYVTDSSVEIFDKCEETYGCEIFQKEEVKGLDVNDWVETRTNKLIKELVKEDESYPLLMVNTLYFKAKWQDNLGGRREEFNLENGDTVESVFNLAEAIETEYKVLEDYSVVKVPLKTGEMVFILPDEKMKVDTLLKERILNNILATVTGDSMDKGNVTVCFPDYECESDYGTYVFEDVLKEMGMKKLMSSEATWAINKKLDNKRVKINQKVRIEVDNEGVEAVAATSLGPTLGAAAIPKPDLELTFDRPFMYILMKDGVPLFIGTVYNPAE